MKPLLMVLAILGISSSYAQGTGSLLVPQHPAEVTGLLTAGQKLSIGEVREVCRQLTDDDFTVAGRYPVPKRSKAVKRHVKNLCEDMDLLIWRDDALADADVEKLYELKLLQLSLLQKGKADAIGMTLRGKLSMGLNSLLTRFKFSYPRALGDEAKNLPLEKSLASYSLKELSELDPKDSPFFEDNRASEVHKRFGDLAKSKRIDAGKRMVVLFDSVSGSGSAPKIRVIDTENSEDEWSLKWGDELHSDVAGSRLFAALGFDVDHPYYRGPDDIFVVFPRDGGTTSAEQMLAEVRRNFKISVDDFVSRTGVIGEAEAKEFKKLAPYKGQRFVTFKECAIEGRPDRVKRLGSIVPSQLANEDRRELRGALLAHLWIDNWDAREENTFVTIHNTGKRNYLTRGGFSDLGTSFGVRLTLAKGDFRVGLPNQFGWHIVRSSSPSEVSLFGVMNALIAPYRKATYADLRWMATKIARIDKVALEKILEHSGWPTPIQQIYFHKLASRRAEILRAFEVTDPHPIDFDRNLTLTHKGEVVVKDGRLVKDIESELHPLGYRNTRGRIRNYGRSL